MLPTLFKPTPHDATQPPFIDANYPEYYTELLSNGVRTERTEPRRLPPDEQHTCPATGISGVEGIDDALSRRLQTLLDVLADISLSLHEREKNVSATMASLTVNRSTPETQLYIVFNRGLGDDGIPLCRHHLETIFNKLRQVPYDSSATDGSLKTIARSLETYLLDLCKVIHEYSFDVFAYRVKKREKRLSEIRGYINQDQTKHFDSQELSELATFFRHVDMILSVIKAQATRQFRKNSMKQFLNIYSYWTRHNLLPGLNVARDKHTLLDKADDWLGKEHNVDFLLKRWAQKIMSFVISASRLFNLTQSSRLRKVILGKFSIEFLTSPRAAPYSCILSSEAIRTVINDTLTGSFLSADYESARESFIEQLKGSSEVVSQFEPTVHAELAMVMAMVNGEIKHVFPYIGVSKLSCIMCSHYIRAFNEVMGQTITVRGSHGKAYPGWSWPISPDHDEELRATFLTHIRQQLRRDFELHAEVHSVVSDGSEMELDPTQDDIEAIAS